MSTELKRAHNLLTMLVANTMEIENLQKNLQRPDLSVEDFEALCSNEFKLYMENIHIYDDLVNSLEKVEKTIDNEFEIAKMKRDAENLRRVEIVEL